MDFEDLFYYTDGVGCAIALCRPAANIAVAESAIQFLVEPVSPADNHLATQSQISATDENKGTTMSIRQSQFVWGGLFCAVTAVCHATVAPA